MNQAHLHLLFNHLPILGTLFGLLILMSGFLVRNNAVKRTALGIFVLSALCAIPAFLTGEGAEEMVESLPGVTENLVEAHADLADIFLWVVGGLGLLSLFTFFADLKAQKIAPILYGITFAAAVGTMILAQQVGSTGGKIRHTEIRSDVAAASMESPGIKTSAETDDDDED